MFKGFKKPDVKMMTKRSFKIGDTEFTKDILNLCFSVNPDLRVKRDVVESNGSKELVYEVIMVADNEAWDQFNRELGSRNMNIIK